MRLVYIKYIKLRPICSISRAYSSKVPSSPVITLDKQEKTRVKIDKNTLALLERLSLVKCDTSEGVQVLEDSIAFADKILHINTDNVQPLYSGLGDENLSLRPDEITQGNCQKDILKNASVTEDDYFVAPQGNIPLHDIQLQDKVEKKKICKQDKVETEETIKQDNIEKKKIVKQDKVETEETIKQDKVEKKKILKQDKVETEETIKQDKVEKKENIKND